MSVDEWAELCDHGARLLACPECWPVPPKLKPAFRGFAGRLVEAFAGTTEAHPMATLGTFLTLVGNEFGPGPHATVGSVKHPPRLNFVVAGETSASRKGTSMADVVSVFDALDPEWSRERLFSGFGSGEAVIARVAERMESTDLSTPRNPRLVVHEGEFTSVLRVAGREGSTLSHVLRDAWDGKALQNNVKQGRLLAPAGNMVSIVAHVTVDELKRELTRSEMANGFANRFLFANVHRPRLIPDPRVLDPTSIAGELYEVIQRARHVQRMHFSPSGEEAWDATYRRLEAEAEAATGLVQPMIARGSAQTRRLAVLYALLDGSELLNPEHIEAAEAFWRYCSESVERIFGDATGNTLADRLVEALKEAGPAGLTRTEQYAVLKHRVSKEQMAVAHAELTAAGIAIVRKNEDTGGRPSEMLVLSSAVEEVEEVEGSPSFLPQVPQFPRQMQGNAR